MGIANTFTFGGVSTSDYGLVVEGSGDYSAPKRATEAINIPGRNGAFQLDKGYYENIEIEYKVVVADATQADFNDTIEAFRNAIVSQIGYQRLEDTYHPGEYRMATYNGGLNDAPTFHGKGAIFKIKFNCKPQRWLTSGESEITVTRGDELTNPTLFESSPLLNVAGTGTINFNGYEIELSAYPYGEIVVVERGYVAENINLPIDTSHINIGDTIYPEFKECEVIDSLVTSNLHNAFTSAEVTSTTNVLEVTTHRVRQSNRNYLRIEVFPDFGDGFVYGTAKTISCSASVAYVMNGVSNYTENISITIWYEGADSFKVTAGGSGTKPSYVTRMDDQFYFPTMYADSTVPNPAPINIDCDLGEAYTNENGVFRSLNQYIDLGSKLPTLAVGTTRIMFDSTITDFKIVPRWWKV